MNTKIKDSWYTISNISAEKTTIFIYGEIGEDWWEPENSNTARALMKLLEKMKGQDLKVRINSFGGSLVDGIAIYNALARHDGNVDTYIDAVAYSAASLIAMSGRRIHMAANSLMMIHAPLMDVYGNALEHREAADILDTYADAMIGSYVREGGPGRNTIEQLVKDGKDHYFTAAEALEMGFIDEVTEAVDIAAKTRSFNLAGYRHPENTMSAPTEPKIAEIEAAAQQRQLETIRARNDTLVPIFAMHKSKPGIADLKDTILTDPTITVDAARKMILDKLGEGSEPANILYTPPTWGVNAHHGEFRHAAVDALLIRAGIPIEDPHPAAKDLRGKSVLNIAETLIQHRGRYDFTGGSPNETVRAAMTTSDFPELLSGVASKSLMIGYESEPASHRLWCREAEIDDFKPTKRVAISEAPELLEIPEHGSYREGALSERAESYSLKTYGRMLHLTRQAIVNDDLSAFTRIPMAFGASAARKEADLVYALLTGNPTMSDSVALFHADHGNLETAAALAVDSLSSARKAMRSQKGIGGEGFLNVVPRYLIVPASLESQALLLVANEHLERTTSGDTMRSGLEWVKNLEVVVDPRLDADSETAWYLAASFNQVDTIEVAHLAGQRGVFTEEDTEFTTDIFRIKARLDFATQVIDWVGLIKNPGA